MGSTSTTLASAPGKVRTHASTTGIELSATSLPSTTAITVVTAKVHDGAKFGPRTRTGADARSRSCSAVASSMYGPRDPHVVAAVTTSAPARLATCSAMARPGGASAGSVKHVVRSSRATAILRSNVARAPTSVDDLGTSVTISVRSPVAPVSPATKVAGSAATCSRSMAMTMDENLRSMRTSSASGWEDTRPERPHRWGPTSRDRRPHQRRRSGRSALAPPTGHADDASSDRGSRPF